MRKQLFRNFLLLTGVVALLVPAVAALAGDKSDDGEKCKKSRSFVMGDGCENITINTEGSELTITMTEDGKSKVTVVDMDQIGSMMGESMSGIAEALAEMQIELQLGQDNSFKLAMDDEEWEVDVDAIMAEVGQALEGAFGDLDSGDWSHHRHYRVDRHHEDDLQMEMDELRSELKDLQKELARLRKVADDS